MNHTTNKLITGLAAAAMLLVATPALAISTSVATGVTANTGGVTVSATVSAKLTKLIATSDTAVTSRINALNALSARVAQMQNVSDTEKASLTADATTNITGLTTLKAKIDADTDLATAQADAKGITGDFRIYALVIPRGYIVAAGDRVETIASMMNGISAKLQTRISTAQTGGADVTALVTAETDLNAKITDAQSQANVGASSTASLVPDQGNSTVAASNHTALVAARANIKTATSDLKSARSDIQTIIAGLKKLEVKSITASTTVQ
jgi:hypothetical protein